MTSETIICFVCEELCTSEVAIKRKETNAFPEVYFPACKLDADGRSGHVECFIAEGHIEPPRVHKASWDAWRNKTNAIGLEQSLIDPLSRRMAADLEESFWLKPGESHPLRVRCWRWFRHWFWYRWLP